MFDRSGGPPPGRGLPIGSYTSQLFASHVYLAEMDHWIKRELKAPGYLRYVDDMFLFGERRADLRRWREEVGAWVLEKRGLRLKYPNARILSTRGHLDALGSRITRTGIEPLPRAMRRLQGRIRAEWERGAHVQAKVSFKRSMASSAGAGLFS